MVGILEVDEAMPDDGVVVGVTVTRLVTLYNGLIMKLSKSACSNVPSMQMLVVCKKAFH